MAPKSKNAKKTAEKSKSTPAVPAVVSGQLKKQIVNRGKISKASKLQRGIVFLKNLPHGFFEAQLKSYFKQFGKVTRLRLVRSRRTGTSKGYAYVEFEVPDVAKIAAESMSTYQMFQKVVKATYIPPEEQKYDYFRTTVKLVQNIAGKTRVVSSKTRHILKRLKEQNNWNQKNYEKRTKSTLAKLDKLKNKFSDLGINFEELTIKPKGLTLSSNSDALSQTNSSRGEPMTDSDLENNDTEYSEDKGDEPQTGSLLLINKRKGTSGGKSVQSKKKKAKATKKDTSLGLQDLLGNTLNDDSSDDDFVPLPGSEDEENEDEVGGAQLKSDARSESDFHTVKISKPDRFDKILKKNPHSKAIQKPNKKKTKKTQGKEKLKVAEAKEIIKKESKKQSFKKIQKKVK